MRKKLILALLLSALFSTRAFAVTVDCAGSALPEQAAYLEQGTTWVALRATGEAYGLPVSWDGRAAGVGTVRAVPGERYLTSVGRCFYVPSVRLQNGTTYVPVRALASALGAELAWDGQTHTVTLGEARGATPGEAYYNADELYWLSRIIHAEAQGEPLAGKIAVGNVVLARVASADFPNTIYDVIFDTAGGVQFTPVKNGTIYNQPSEESIIAAKLCLEGADLAAECLYFFNPAKATSSWISANRTYAMTIGCHQFYY